MGSYPSVKFPMRIFNFLRNARAFLRQFHSRFNKGVLQYFVPSNTSFKKLAT
jgi:hypothetical protein